MRAVHRLDVEVEGKIPILVRAFQHGAVMHEAGGIEQDVDLPTRFAMAATAALSRTSSRATSGDAFLGERSEALFVDVGGKHGGALARKGDGAGAADAHRASGHECAFALQAV